MQGTYRDERTVRDTPSFRISSPNMLVAWLGIAFVRRTKFFYFLTLVHQSIHPFLLRFTSILAEIYTLSSHDLIDPYI